MPLFRPYEHRRATSRTSSALSDQLISSPDDAADDDGVADEESATAPAVTAAPSSESTVAQSKSTSASGSAATKPVAGARLQPKGSKKDRPTRTRAEAEKARREQLHPTLTPKEAKARNRELRFQARQEALKKQESTPERELLRDYIDSRWTVAEFMLPVFVLLWAASLVSVTNVRLQYVLSLVMVAAIVVMFLNIWWLWRGFKREAQQRLKHPNFRGLLMYGINRMIFIRRFRRPPPRIPRGGDY